MNGPFHRRIPVSFRAPGSLLLLIALIGLSNTGCREDSEYSICGDGVAELGEECDDGNARDNDGCSSACVSESICGDGILDPDERCDDGNREDGDGCQRDCQWQIIEQQCRTLEPLGSGVCEIIHGDGTRLLVGDVLAPEGVLRGGEVLVDENGHIACVGCDCATRGATVIRCPSGVISPGLINSHDHITFIQNDPYTDTGERYEHRHDWRRGRNGHTPITGNRGNATTDQIRWGELRFLVGGATSTIGSGSATGFLRNLDRPQQEGLDQPSVHYATFPLGDIDGEQLVMGCGYPDIDSQADIADDDAYFAHIAEGIDAFSRNEFVCVSGMENGGEDLVEPQSAFIHAIGLLPGDYARMAREGTSLIWSPRSNITLYGDTAQVTAAWRLGVSIALGTDWIPTGSMNLQRELSCADSFNREHLNGFFPDVELWRMVTTYGAQAAAMDDAIGALEAGLTADIAIFDGAEKQAYRAVIDARPQDVVLVMRGGQVLYGDDALVTEVGAGTCDAIDVCGTAKRLCVMAEIGTDLPGLQSSAGNLYPLFFCDAPTDEPSCTPARPESVNGSSTYSGAVRPSDHDGDGIDNEADICPLVFNPVRPVDDGEQADFDRDGVGDACDPCPLDADIADCEPFDDSDLDDGGELRVEFPGPYAFGP